MRQPAVLGRIRTPCRSSTSTIEPAVVASTRRMATVHIDVPDAAIVSSMTCMLGAPPVPMISREANSVPAMTNGSSTMINLPGRR